MLLKPSWRTMGLALAVGVGLVAIYLTVGGGYEDVSDADGGCGLVD
jgi:hypothetical protein